MKIMDKLHNKIKYNKKVMLFLTIIVIFGIISGSFLSVVLKSNDKSIVIESIKGFINNISSINNLNLLKNNLLINLIIIFGIWILGISIIGIIIVICLVFWKSFTLGFTISGFILTYHLKGLILAFIYIFPHLIINLLVFMYIGSYAIKFSILIIKCIFNKVNLNLRKLMVIYIKVLIYCLIANVISSLYESFIVPHILKYIIRFIKL